MTDLSTVPRAALATAEQERLRAVTNRPPVQTLLTLLNDAQDQTLIVGGAVRNALMDYPVADIDLATTLTPNAVMQRAAKAGVKTVPTGLDHGTLTLVLDGHGFEVTTLRQDIETDGRRATIAYSTSFAEDAGRRDFTMNALYADAQAVLYDPVAGLADLRNRHLRFIGDARTRIREDYLRILRFFRFFADYATGDIDADGLSACLALKDGLSTLSRERIGHEWLKVLMARRACETIALMQDSGLTTALLPSPAKAERLAALLQLMPDADAMTRLYALLEPDETLIAACQTGFRLSNVQTARLTTLARALETVPQPLSTHPPHRTALQHWAFHHTPAVARTALALHQSASLLKDPAPTRLALHSFEPVLEAVPAHSPFSGRDFLAQGIQSGPRLGEILRKADFLWIEAGFPDDPARLKDLIRQAVNQEKD
jgi:poly(A) polymerase